VVKDAGFNAIYARDLQAMEALATLIGDDPARFAQRRRRVGFREYYDPIHGDGLGAKDFTWSGLLIDM
jgi:hypothetical protein